MGHITNSDELREALHSVIIELKPGGPGTSLTYTQIAGTLENLFQRFQIDQYEEEDPSGIDILSSINNVLSEANEASLFPQPHAAKVKDAEKWCKSLKRIYDALPEQARFPSATVLLRYQNQKGTPSRVDPIHRGSFKEPERIYLTDAEFQKLKLSAEKWLYKINEDLCYLTSLCMINTLEPVFKKEKIETTKENLRKTINLLCYSLKAKFNEMSKYPDLDDLFPKLLGLQFLFKEFYKTPCDSMTTESILNMQKKTYEANEILEGNQRNREKKAQNSNIPIDKPLKIN
jgi:hypothetical protein